MRGIYFATHFGNWYDYASERELREYVEELALWGCNQVRVWFDMHDFACADVDPARPFELVYAGRRPDRAPAARALALLAAYEVKMPPARRTQWRWRILKLRAEIDARLAEGAELSAPDLRAAFDELAAIYHVGARTGPFLTPPGPKLRPGADRAGAL